jgi:serine/threonine protein kinase
MGSITPAKLGRYEIVDELGKGAMGVVYLARDPLIGRLVALKTFRIGYSVKDQDAEQFRIRFLREAQSAGILTHPNIVTIHDVVEAGEEGLAFIAMEYVKGTNLKLVLQGDKALTWQFVLDVVAQVGDALDYAHAHRVIHRDVKPANILITENNKVKITDFGIARLDTSNLTQEGQLLGTPNYMAPEQIQGKEVDHRADLFSLGVVLYEMLTRHKPFHGENLTVVSHRIVYDPFTPPREYARELPLGVEQILNRALDKEPAQRYQRARDLFDELRKSLGASQGVAATLPGSPLPPVPPPPPSPPALNDTQSLSSTVVLPPAEPPGVAAANGRPAAPLDAPAIAPTAPTVKAATPRATSPGQPQAGVRRGLLWAAALVALAVLGGAGYMLWQAWAPPLPVASEPAPVPTANARLTAMLEEGQRLLTAGRYADAAAALRRAEAAAPERTDIRALRESSERSARLLASASDKSSQIAAQLELARQAMTDKRFGEALTAAAAVLQLDPANAEANDLKGRAQAAQLLAKRKTAKPAPGSQAGPGETIAALPPPVDTSPAPVEPASESREATLQVTFDSAFPRGTFIVYVDDRKVLAEPFRFVERGGLFRSKTAPGSFSRQLTVAAGTAKVRVYVTPEGRKAQVKTFNGNFLGGSSRTLEVKLSETGELTANLN